MKHNAYSIFDVASGLYSRPFFTQADNEAIRSFKDIALDADHPIGKHPADYTLFRIGIWDDTTGNFSDELNGSLCNGLEVVSNAQNVNQDNITVMEHSLPEET